MLKNRNEIFKQCEEKFGDGFVKIIDGPRFSGKSTVLRLFSQCIQNRHLDSNVIYIDKSNNEFDFIKDAESFYSHVISNIDDAKRNFLLVDEIEKIMEFEFVLKSVSKTRRCEIFITGRNLISENAESFVFLTGMVETIHLGFLSYEEFLKINDLENTNDTFEKFLYLGGVPAILPIYSEKETSIQFLRHLFSTILIENVISKEKMRDAEFLLQLSEFLAYHTGEVLSATKVMERFKSIGKNFSKTAIIAYLKSLEASLIIDKLSRFDFQENRTLELSEKYFFADVGLCNAVGRLSVASDLEKMLKTVVYNYLKSKNYSLQTGKFRGVDIDFVARKDGETMLVQIKKSKHTEKQRRQELSKLNKIKTITKKYIVSFADEEFEDAKTNTFFVNAKNLLVKSSL